jgi:hypothetical protein
VVPTRRQLAAIAVGLQQQPFRCAAGCNPGEAPSRCHARGSATESRKIVWTDEAVGQLEAIVTYISVLNPAAASGSASGLWRWPTALPNSRLVAVMRETVVAR